MTAGRKIFFVENCNAESTVYFFVIILNFVFHLFFKTNALKKNSVPRKKMFKNDFFFSHISEYSKFVEDFLVKVILR